MARKHSSNTGLPAIGDDVSPEEFRASALTFMRSLAGRVDDLSDRIDDTFRVVRDELRAVDKQLQKLEHMQGAELLGIADMRAKVEGVLRERWASKAELEQLAKDLRSLRVEWDGIDKVDGSVVLAQLSRRDRAKQIAKRGVATGGIAGVVYVLAELIRWLAPLLR